MDVSALIVGICIGITGSIFLHRRAQSDAASKKSESDWRQIEAEWRSINSTHVKFGRTEISKDHWWEMCRRALENAIPDALQRARDLAVYDPKRDGERWKPDAPVFKMFEGRE